MSLVIQLKQKYLSCIKLKKEKKKSAVLQTVKKLDTDKNLFLISWRKSVCAGVFLCDYIFLTNFKPYLDVREEVW